MGSAGTDDDVDEGSSDSTTSFIGCRQIVSMDTIGSETSVVLFCCSTHECRAAVAVGIFERQSHAHLNTRFVDKMESTTVPDT
jgi:hypothetical protein